MSDDGRAMTTDNGTPMTADKCKHGLDKFALGSIKTGIQNGHPTAWCTECGRITWCSDGGVSPEDMRRNDYDEWVSQNVEAWGCDAETRGHVRCNNYCGSCHCAVSLAANRGDEHEL